MKQYKSLIVIAFACLTLASCSDYLTTQLMNQKTTSNFYQTPSDAMTALTGCYNGLYLIGTTGNMNPAFNVVSEVMSDNCLGGGGASDPLNYPIIDAENPNINPGIIDLFLPHWNLYYQAVFRCNELIQNEDNVDWASEPTTLTKDQCDGEVKFLRAYFYFDMVRLWGNIPLLTTASTDNLPQASPDSVYMQIVSDLKDAISELPAVSVASQPYTGRVTKWAAEAMLARVFLFYTGYYGKTDVAGFTKTDALAAVEDVIANSGHSLVPNFTSLWPGPSTQKGITYAGELNPEIVFSIRYTYANSNYYSGQWNGNNWMVQMTMRAGGVKSYLYPFGDGWGMCNVDPKLYAAFDPNDSIRRFASIINMAVEYPDYTHTSELQEGGGYGPSLEYTGFQNKKYVNLANENGTDLAVAAGGVNNQVSQYQDYFVIRYADVLLMAAELGSPNTESYFNQVHTRAGLPSIGSGLTKAQILDERRFEFAFEGIRYWDLLRQGINAAAATIVANTTLNMVHDGSNNPAGNFTAQNFITTGGFLQIPQSQITASGGVLKQNPGW